jgi:hypothetical protein
MNKSDDSGEVFISIAGYEGNDLAVGISKSPQLGASNPRQLGRSDKENRRGRLPSPVFMPADANRHRAHQI